MKCKVDSNLIPFSSKILDEKNISYAMEEKANDMFISTELSEDEYEIIQEGALCLEQQGDSRTPVVSFRTFIDITKRPKGPYRTLKRDNEKFKEYFENQ